MKYVALYITLASSTLSIPAFAQTQVIRRTVAEEITLDKLLEPGALFQHTKESFMKDAGPLGFEWTSSAQDAARSARPKSKYLGQTVYETIVRFERLASLIMNTMRETAQDGPFRIADIGGGAGTLARTFARAGHHVTCVDISKDLLEVGKHRAD